MRFNKILKKLNIPVKNLKIAVFGFFIPMICLYSFFAYKSYFPSTDNAYVNANTILLAAKLDGYVQKIWVKNNQKIHKGQILLSIDPIDYQCMYDEAKLSFLVSKHSLLIAGQNIKNNQANLKKAQASLKYFNAMVRRYQGLYDQNISSKENLDKIRNNYTQSVEALKQAEIELHKTKLAYEAHLTKVNIAKVKLRNAKNILSETKLRSPVTGYVANLNLKAGQLIQKGQNLFNLIDDTEWWIDANFKETNLSRIKPGQKASIKLDMYEHKFSGTIDSISPASGASFSLFPAQNTSGNWVKVTQRFAVRIKISQDNKYPLRQGASADVKVNTLGAS